jgi:hypothetical protein
MIFFSNPFFLFQKEKKAKKNMVVVAEHQLQYPAASKFIDWLLPLLKSRGVEYRNIDTGGDNYKIVIFAKAPSQDVDVIRTDWKHLSSSEVEEFNDVLETYNLRLRWVEAKKSRNVDAPVFIVLEDTTDEASTDDNEDE